jgi:hypothetical protein
MRLAFRFLAVVLLAVPVTAQRGSLDARGTLGYAGFVDDSPQNHFLAGAGFRYFLTERISVGPELDYLYRDEDDKDLFFQGTIAVEFSRRRARPYLVGGLGLMHHMTSRFSVTEWAGTGGFGVKIYLTPRWFVAPEFRAGWEPHIRITGSLGYTWPGR